MSQQQFDDLTRSMASVPRGHALKAIGGGVLALAGVSSLLGTRHAEAGANQTCRPTNSDCNFNKQCCSGRCSCNSNGNCHCK